MQISTLPMPPERSRSPASPARWAIATTGNSAADLALGYAATATRTPTAPNISVRYNSLGFFVQDDWKVTPHLTLNIGVRYEDFLPITDTSNILSNWRYPTPGNPGGSIQAAGLNGSGRTVYQNDANNFAPRVGLSWQPYGNDRTVVHASYGMFYNAPSIGNGAILNMGLNVPFRLTQGINSTPTAQSVLSTNPFPVVAGSSPDGTTARPFTNVAPVGIDPNFRTLYLDEWGADIQQQISRTIAVTIGYIGNGGVKIPRPIAANQGINPIVNATATAVSSTRPYTGITVAVPNPLGIGAVNGMAQNPVNVQWANITEYLSVGHSSFHALTVKGQKSLGNGISFILAYTYAHAIDNASGYASTSQASSGTPQNSFNLQAEKGSSDFNVGQRIALSPVIELPFGKNKPYLSKGLGAKLAGGFQLSGIYQYDSGRPFTIGSSQNRSGSVYGSDRPNVIGDPNAGPKTVGQWFNTSAFVANNYGTFGNEHRNALTGPTLSQLDVAIQRSIAISERFSAQLRFESFNVANKANFFNPLGTGTGNFQAASTAQGAANGNTNFGKLTQAGDPRSIQFSGKLVF